MSSADDADTLALFATYDDYWRYYNNCQQQQQQVHGQALPSLPSPPVHVDVPSPSPSPSSLSWCVRADECAHTRSHVATTTTMAAAAAAGRKAVQRQLCSACVVGCGVVTPSPSASQPRCSLGSVCCHDGGGEDDDGDGVSASRARSTATTSATTAVGATTVARELFDDATPSPTLQAPTRHVNDTDSVTVLMSSDDDDDDDEEMMDNTRARAAAAFAVTDEERAAVLRLYAGKLTPTEQQCDDLVAYLAWAQQRSRVRRDMLATYTRHHHHNNNNNSNESEAVAMALLAAYAQQHSAPTATGDSDKETAAVYVATPQSPARHGSDKQQQQQHNDSKGTDDDSSSSNSSAAAAAATTRNTMTAALTPHAAPARFVRWVASEVDCYEGVLSMLLPHSSSSRVHARHV